MTHCGGCASDSNPNIDTSSPVCYIATRLEVRKNTFDQTVIVSLDGRSLDAGMPPQLKAEEKSLAEMNDAEQRQARSAANTKYMIELVDKVIKGQLPRDRELRSYEPEKLSPTMINAIMDQASGMEYKDVCAKYDINYAYFSVVMQHPDAQYLRSAILGMTAEKIADPMERVRGMAGEALSIKAELMRTAKSEQVRDKAASDILAMNGLGGRGVNINVNSNNRNTLQVPKEAAMALASAMVLAKSEDHSDYSRFIASGQQGDEIIAEHRQLDGGLPGSLEQAALEDGTSHIPSPDQEAENTKAALAEEKEWREESQKRRIA